MNHIMRSLVLLGFLFTCNNLISQNEYYVSPNGSNSSNGSSNNPWLNIDYGVNQLEAGDILHVQSGTYSELVHIGANNSGSSSASIQILAEDDVVLDLDGIQPDGVQGVFTFQNCAHVVLDGFEIRNFETGTGFEIYDTPIGIYITGSCQDIQINNNIIHNIANHSTCTQFDDCGPSANGIGIFGNTTAGIQDLWLEGNEIYDCTLSSSEAFVLNGNINRFTILDNYVHDNNNIGIDFIGYEGTCSACPDDEDRARNGLIKNNIAINNTTTLNGGNPWYDDEGDSAAGFYADGASHLVFDGNEASGNDIGIAFGSENPGKATEEIVVINNIVHNNLAAGIVMGGYAEDDSGPGGGHAQFLYIHNNSFYNNYDWGTEFQIEFRVWDTHIANNIIYGAGDVIDNFYEEPNSQSMNLSWGNNVWFAPDLYGQNMLPGNAIVGNPEYIDPDNGDLQIGENSVARDTGIIQNNIENWDVDFWGSVIDIHGETCFYSKQRVQGKIDIGADEYDLISGNQYLLNEEDVQIFPDPTNGIVNIKGITGSYQITILDVNGQIHQVLEGQNEYQIDIADLPTGMYFLEIENISQSNLYIHRIIKE